MKEIDTQNPAKEERVQICDEQLIRITRHENELVP